MWAAVRGEAGHDDRQRAVSRGPEAPMDLCVITSLGGALAIQVLPPSRCA